MTIGVCNSAYTGATRIGLNANSWGIRLYNGVSIYFFSVCLPAFKRLWISEISYFGGSPRFPEFGRAFQWRRAQFCSHFVSEPVENGRQGGHPPGLEEKGAIRLQERAGSRHRFQRLEHDRVFVSSPLSLSRVPSHDPKSQGLQRFGRQCNFRASKLIKSCCANPFELLTKGR